MEENKKIEDQKLDKVSGGIIIDTYSKIASKMANDISAFIMRAAAAGIGIGAAISAATVIAKNKRSKNKSKR